MEQLTVSATITAPLEKVWAYYTEPEHIVQWAFADDSWHAPHAENDLRMGGTFVTRMESRDGAQGFDFGGTYDEVITNKLIAYTMDGEMGVGPRRKAGLSVGEGGGVAENRSSDLSVTDARKAVITFEEEGGATKVTVSFDPENENPIALQIGGWQAILNNFKKYTEGNSA